MGLFRGILLVVSSLLLVVAGGLLVNNSAQINPLFYPYYAAQLLLLASAIFVACAASRSVPRSVQLWRAALVMIAYGALTTIELFLHVLVVPSSWAQLGLVSSLAFIVVGCLTPRRISFFATAIVLIVATLFLMKAAQLQMYVDGTAAVRYAGLAVPEWAFLLGILIALLCVRHRADAGI